jgi:hypothetical protein
MQIRAHPTEAQLCRRQSRHIPITTMAIGTVAVIDLLSAVLVILAAGPSGW